LGETLSTEEVAFLSANMSQQVSSSSPAVACALVFFRFHARTHARTHARMRARTHTSKHTHTLTHARAHTHKHTLSLALTTRLWLGAR
jgi:hypothetical protein